MEAVAVEVATPIIPEPGASPEYEVGVLYEDDEGKFSICQWCGGEIRYRGGYPAKTCPRCKSRNIKSKCEVCGDLIPHKGRGRPKKTCDECRVEQERNRRPPGRPRKYQRFSESELIDAVQGFLGPQNKKKAAKISAMDVFLGGRVKRRCGWCGAGVKYCWDEKRVRVLAYCKKGCGWSTSHNRNISYIPYNVTIPQPTEYDGELKRIDPDLYPPMPKNLRPCNCPTTYLEVFWGDSVRCTRCGNWLPLSPIDFRYPDRP